MYGCDPWKDKEDAIERRLDQLEGRNIDHDQALLDLQVEVDNDRAAMEAYASAMLTGDALNDAMLVVSDELETKIPISDKGVPEGVATLDVSGKVPSSQIPAVPVALQTFTNSALGGIKGSATAGRISANADGTGSVNGWNDKANLINPIFPNGITVFNQNISKRTILETNPTEYRRIVHHKITDGVNDWVYSWYEDDATNNVRYSINVKGRDGLIASFRIFSNNGSTYVTFPIRDTSGSSDGVNYSQLLSAQSDTITTVANTYARADAVGAVNGIAGLDATGKVPTAQLPARGISDVTGLQTVLDGKLSAFNLYEHTIRVVHPAEGDYFVFRLTVLNQSATPFTLQTLWEYLGSEPNDFKQCSGSGFDGTNELMDLMEVRGANANQFAFSGIYRATGVPVTVGVTWTVVDMYISDRVRQIV